VKVGGEGDGVEEAGSILVEVGIAVQLVIGDLFDERRMGEKLSVCLCFLRILLERLTVLERDEEVTPKMGPGEILFFFSTETRNEYQCYLSLSGNCSESQVHTSIFFDTSIMLQRGESSTATWLAGCSSSVKNEDASKSLS